VSGLAPWVTDVDLTDDARMANIRMPGGVSTADLCDAATDYLWRASGARYNARAINVRPSRLVSSCGCAWGPFGLGYGSAGGGWSSFGFGPGWGGCNCDGGALALRAPASAITVTVEGVALAASAWTLYDGHLLVRNALPGGAASWPCCQSLASPDGGPGTWSVAYTTGTPPPALGVLAARELVVECALQVCGKPNRLPTGTTSVTRTGVSVNLAGKTDVSRAGSLPLTSMFLEVSNPNDLLRAPCSVSPDTLIGGSR